MEVVALRRAEEERAGKGHGPRQALGGRSVDLRHVLGDSRGRDALSIHLLDLSLPVQEEERGQAQVLAAVEEIPAEDGVRSRHLLARDRHRNRESPNRRPDLCLVRQRVDGEGQDRRAGRGQRRSPARELLERRPGSRRRRGPEQQHDRMAREAGQGALLAGEVLQCKVRGRERLVEPGPARRGNGGTGRRGRVYADGGRAAIAERLGPHGALAFFDPDPMVEGKAAHRLGQAARPHDRRLRGAAALAQAEQELLRVLGEEAGADLHELGPPELIGLHGHARPDRIAVALRPHETDGERRIPTREVVAEDTELGGGAGRHEHEVGIPVAVVVEHRERAAVLVQVEAGGAGDLLEAAPAIVAQQHVALVLGLRPVANEQPVRGPPAVVVEGARLAHEGRVGHDLPPEEAVHVDRLFAGVPREHPVHDVEVFPAVVVEVDRVGGPRPAPELGVGGERRILERAVAPVAEERVAADVAAVDLVDVGRGVGHEARLRRHALAGGGPHVAGVDVEVAVVVVVHERRAHARAVVLDARPRGHVTEADLAVDEAVVVVEVLAPEVVRHQQVGPAVLVVVGPGGGEAEAVVVLIQPHLLGHVHEAAVAVVAEQDLGRAVVGVVVRRGRSGLVLADADEVAVGAQVQVDEAVAVVVRHRRRGQRSLQRLLELERVRVAGEVALAVVDEEQRAAAREQDQVLVAVVVHVGEENG